MTLHFWLTTTAVIGPNTHDVRTALDCVKIQPVTFGIDVDSNNDGSVTSQDDAVEEDKPGMYVVGATTWSPNEFDLVISGHSGWSDLETPTATLSRSGTGTFDVLDSEGNVILSATQSSTTLPASVASSSGTTTYTIRASEEVTAGEATLSFKVEADGNVVAQDRVQLSVLRPRLHSVSFSGDGKETILRDDGTGSYGSNEWKDNATIKDNSAAQSIDQRYPICFHPNAIPKIACEADLGMQPDQVTTIKIKAEGDASVDISPATVTLTSGSLTLSATDASNAFATKAKFFNPFHLSWSFSLDGGTTWWPLGVSDNRVYVPLKDPWASSIYESLLDISLRGVATEGTTSSATVMTALWNQFKDPSGGSGVTRKAMDGDNVSDGATLVYWATTGATSDWSELLDTANGQCGAFAKLFVMCAAAAGVGSSNDFEVLNVTPNGGGYLLVKHFAFGDCIKTGTNGDADTGFSGDDVQITSVGASGTIAIYPGTNGALDTNRVPDDEVVTGTFPGTTFPYVFDRVNSVDLPGTIDGDAVDQPGVPAQGQTNPRTVFGNHFVASWNGKIYDPSYGTGSNWTMAEHEANSFDGFAKVISGLLRARKNSSTTTDCTYTALTNFP